VEEWIPICIELRERIQELQLKFFLCFFILITAYTASYQQENRTVYAKLALSYNKFLRVSHDHYLWNFTCLEMNFLEKRIKSDKATAMPYSDILNLTFFYFLSAY